MHISLLVTSCSFFDIRRDFHLDRYGLAHGDMQHRELVCGILIAGVGPVEVLASVHCHDLQVYVGKCLTKADSLSSVEWSPTVGVALGSLGCQAHVIHMVEPLREELTWTLPFVLVVVKVMETNAEFVSSLEMVLTYLTVIQDIDER